MIVCTGAGQSGFVAVGLCLTRPSGERAGQLGSVHGYLRAAGQLGSTLFCSAAAIPCAGLGQSAQLAFSGQPTRCTLPPPAFPTRGVPPPCLHPPPARRWGSYGVWQQVLWHQVDRLRGHHWHSEGEILAVQGAAGILTGCTSAFLTNPLDVVKTRLQTAGAEGAAASAAAVAAAPAAQGAPAMAGAAAAGGSGAAEAAAAGAAAAGAAVRPTWRQVASHLRHTEGAAGFVRGVAPRLASSSNWGTTMVSV